MGQILIDTNILVYAFDPHNRERQDKALLVLEALVVSGSGRLSVQSLSEFISATTKERRKILNIAEAIKYAEHLARIFQIFDLTPLVVLEAARGVRDYGMSFYDAQIWAAARLNQVQVIFSEDFSAGQVIEGIRFANPLQDDFELSDWI